MLVKKVDIIILIFIMLFTISIVYVKVNDKRFKYEDLLLSMYSSIPVYNKEDLKYIPKPEHPDLASYQNFFMTLDPELGYVPLERLKESFRYMQTLENKRHIEWVNTNSNMGGRTRSFAFDPNDSDNEKVWAGGVTGGLWFNNNISNQNSPWIPVDDLWDNLVVSCIAFDPNNTNVLYVGTGEANTAIVTYRESSGRGIGIWKSSDGGVTWELLESTENYSYITDIAVDNDSNVYIGVVSGTYYGLQESLPSDGLYKSINGGSTWDQVLPLINDDTTPYAPSDIEITQNGKIFVGTMKNLNGNGGAYILHSDTGNIDDWTVYDYVNELIISQEEYNIPGRVVLSSSYSNPNVVYAAIGSGFINDYGFNYSYGNHIIKTSNNGNTWSFVNTPDDYDNHSWATLAWHAFSIKVDPNNEETVYIGGLDLFKSVDGCNNWDKLSDWALMYDGGGDKYVHADIHSITFKNNNSNIMIVTSDGGIFYTDNALSNDINFHEHNSNYNTLQYYTGAIHPIASTKTFVGGLQDNGTLIYTEESECNFENNYLTINNMISGGDGAYCFWDNNEPNLLITSTYYNRYYLFDDCEYVNYFNGNNGTFISPSDYDYINNNLYANAVRFDGSAQNRIYRILNINDNPSDNNINLFTDTNVPYSTIKYSGSSEDNSTIFIGTQSGYLYKTIFQNNNTFEVVEIGSDDFPTGNISSISTGNDENFILVTFSNYGIPSIWLTYDGGNT